MSDCIRGPVPYGSYVRRVFILSSLLILASVSSGVAFLLRFDFALPQSERTLFFGTLPLLLVFRCAMFLLFGLERRSPRHASSVDFVPVSGSVLTGTLLFAMFVRWVTPTLYFPRSVVFCDALVLQILLLGFYSSREIVRLVQCSVKPNRQRVIVVGQGNSLPSFLREIDRSRRWVAVGVLCEDVASKGEKWRGTTVAGTFDTLLETVRGVHADLVCFVTSGMQLSRVLELVAQCRTAGVNFVCLRSKAVVPDNPSVGAEEVRIEEILQREQNAIEISPARKLIKGRRVLVTGGGGSIGSELCRQIARLQPSRIYILDRCENNLFFVSRDIRERFPGLLIHPLLLDITDADALDREFNLACPDFVFHAAAHKHVGMMESNPREALYNNVIGTYHVALAAARVGTERFINISTDKAVRPRSYMGLSKRLAEICVREINTHFGTRFVTVRFGNVAGSTGSVVQLFRQQIAGGGPVRVTDPAATRFFMTVPEAVRLVLQAALLGIGGDIFVLDMGEPTNIYELARTMIRISGYVPGVDIPIEFTGLGPAEKLHEELNDSDEEIVPTINDRIQLIRSHILQGEGLLGRLPQWRALLREFRTEDVLADLTAFRPDLTADIQLDSTGLVRSPELTEIGSTELQLASGNLYYAARVGGI